MSFQITISIAKFQSDPSVLASSSSSSNVTGAETTPMGSGGYVSESIVLSPESIIGKSQDGSVVARLLGDFAPWQEPAELSGKYLFVPAVPRDHPRVAGGTANWMLIDKEAAEFGGDTCNKIGVSFPAFRYEPGRCSRPPNSCLHNQLDDFHNKDLLKVSSVRARQATDRSRKRNV